MADDLYYGDASLLQKRVFCTTAIVTAPVIWSTAAGTGGPLLWNNTKTVNARILKVGFSVTTASTVAGALGFTGGISTAPSSTAAVSGTANLFIGAPGPAILPYATGTVSAAGTFFLPFAQITTGALTVSESTMAWADINRLITVPPGYFISVAGSATLSTAVIQIGLVWEEVPIS
jgi:hypothetical protein